MIRRTLAWLTSGMVAFFLKAYCGLWRVRLVGHPGDATPHLYAHWHGDEGVLVGVFSGRGYAVMSSRSRDGSWMAGLLGALGYRVVRGSSSRGGAGGLKGLVDCVRHEQRSAAIAVDGPRGPVHQVKPGIVLLAQSTGLPIIPAVATAYPRWNFRGAWNQGYFPRPFARCVVLFGEPFSVPPQMDGAARLEVQQSLKDQLQVLKSRAELLLKNP